MSYQVISVKETVNSINGNYHGWFLPSVQRPYVWGSRYESELYICKLFDSILRGYPIGSIIVWNTDAKIPFRQFMENYNSGDEASIVDKGLWKRKDKWLVYDGQQRLQTLYSCLKYTFNEKVLMFDTLFDLSKTMEDRNEVGFKFINSRENDYPSHWIRMNELFTKDLNDKSKFRRHIFEINPNLNSEEQFLIEKNIDSLFDVFVKTDKKSISYFPVEDREETKVNEIFQRLNSGGVPLSQSDLLFSRIKEKYPYYEENMQILSKNILNSTGHGILYDSYNILQVVHQIIKGTSRVDPKKVKNNEIDIFDKVGKEIVEPILSFFTDFLWGQFKINNQAIIPKKLAIIPIIIYFYVIYKRGIKFRKFNRSTISNLKKYLILSQINDWNIQSLTDEFCKTIFDFSEKTTEIFDFPLDKFNELLEKSKKRKIELHEVNFVDYEWFSLKILTPNRIYQFDPDIRGRFNPEIDHIFPKHLKQQTEDYYSNVDIIWNMQPVKGEINNYKRKKHPKDFFINEGAKYLNEYDFLPSLKLNDKIWSEPLNFIRERKKIMIKYLKDVYGLDLL